MRAHYGTLNFGHFFKNGTFLTSANAKSQRVRQEVDQLQKFFQKFHILRMDQIRAKSHLLIRNSHKVKGGGRYSIRFCTASPFGPARSF